MFVLDFQGSSRVGLLSSRNVSPNNRRSNSLNRGSRPLHLAGHSLRPVSGGRLPFSRQNSLLHPCKPWRISCGQLRVFGHVSGLWKLFAHFAYLRSSFEFCSWSSSSRGRWSRLFLLSMQRSEDEGGSKPQRREICIEVTNFYSY